MKKTLWLLMDKKVAWINGKTGQVPQWYTVAPIFTQSKSQGPYQTTTTKNPGLLNTENKLLAARGGWEGEGQNR